MSEMEENTHNMLFQAACYESQAAVLREKEAMEKMRPFYLLNPKVYPDGNQWCALYGDNIQDGVVGFGDTPDKASIQFDIEWLNAKAV